MFGDFALLAKPRILYGGSFPETEFFIDPWIVTLKIDHRLHGSGTVLLGVSFGARRFNYKSVFHWEKASGEVQPLSSTWITSFHEERKETTFTRTWISPLHTGKVQHNVCRHSWPVSEEFLS